MMPEFTANPNPKPRGRPRVEPYSAAEVAELLAVEPELVERALGGRFRKDFFPHAFERAGQWRIPPRDVRALLGPGLPRPLWVSEFAELIGFSVPYVNELIRAGIIRSTMILGSRRVLATEFWNLPKHRPTRLKKHPRIIAGDGAAAPPPSFFSEGASS